MKTEDVKPEVLDFINDLLAKANKTNQVSEKSSNLHMEIDGLTVPVRVDDKQLFYIGCALLPNIVNYLVNILPQLFYPYIVAYLQDLTEDSENPFTINDLYELLKDLK